MQSLHAAFTYIFQDHLLRYGFLEHDDYQLQFKTYTLTLGQALLLPAFSYTFTLIFVTFWTVLYKYSLTWVLFKVFSNLPKGMARCRRYISAGLGLLFMALFAAGFFMNLYYLFVCASIVLYWSVTISYSKVSKENRKDVIKRELELKRSWLQTDVLLLNIVLLTMHWDRFVLETWRFKDFEKTFTYAYDAENFFTYPFFLFQVGVLISTKENLHHTFLKVT